MKRMIKIIRKVDLEAQYAHTLRIEVDYELLCLRDALAANDQKEIDRSKSRLSYLSRELKGLQSYV